MTPISFDAEGARLLVKATRAVLRRPVGRVRPPAPPRPLAPNKVVKTTTTISPGSGGTPGKGTATLQAFNGTSFDDLGTVVTVYNLTSATIAAGAYVQVVVVDGYFFYDVTDCQNGS